MKRLRYIDIARGIGILLVVYAHIIDIGVFDMSNVKEFIYAFHMPLFFIISGLCFRKPSNNVSYKGYVWKRFKRLMIPYFIWSCIYMLFLWQQQDHIEVWAMERLYAIITMRGIAPLWFLPTLFFSDIIAEYILYKNKKFLFISSMAMFIFFSFLLVYIFQTYDIVNEDMLYAYPCTFVFRQVLCTSFLLSGIYLKKWFSKVNFHALSTIKLFTIITLTCLFLMFIQFNSNSPVNIHLFEVRNLFTLYITAFLGFFMIMALSIVLEKTLLNKFFCWFGTNSLFIMVLHYPPIPIMHFIYTSIFVEKSLLFTFIDTCILLVVIAVMIFMINTIKKTIIHRSI